MHPYKINPKDGQSVLVVARTPHEASDLYITWSAANERVHQSFMIDDMSVDALVAEQQAPVQQALAAGLVGIVHLDDNGAWTFSPPMWQPLGDEVPAPQDDDHSVIRIFEMRDLTPIEAFVLASDYDRANELFEQHLRAHGGDPDEGILYREVGLEHLNESANDAVHEALDIGWEGLVTCDANGRWSFTTPLGCRRE
jgi:hypothetical protein